MGEHFVDFLFHTVTEAVNGNEVRFLVPGQPYIMDVAVEEFFYLAAGVDVVPGDGKGCGRIPYITS